MNFRLTLLLLLLQKKSVGFPFLYLLAAVHLSVSWRKYNTDKCANKIAKKKNPAQFNDEKCSTHYDIRFIQQLKPKSDENSLLLTDYAKVSL